MKGNYSLISVKLVNDVIKEKGFYYIKTSRLYGDDYMGPQYIVATDDKDFESTHPEFEGMIILAVSKFIKIVEVINDYANNEMREKKRQERYHNDEGYYEEIPDNDENGMSSLVVKDHPQNPVSDEVESTIIREQLLTAIDNLSECAKRRVYAYYFCGKTHREIAAEEGINRNAVEKSIYSALKKIKKYL